MDWIMDHQAVLDKAQALLKEGRDAAGRNDWHEAEARFADALQLGGRLDPAESDLPVVAMLAMAQLSYERGQKEEAIQRATSAFALSAETENFSGWQFPLYELMANLFDELGVPHRAIPFRHIMVRLWRELEGSDSEKTAAACAHLGQSFERLGFHEHATLAYSEAVRADGRHRRRLAESLHRAGRLEEAEAAYRQLLEEEADRPDAAAVRSALADLLSQTGRPEEASQGFYEAYRQHLAAGPGNTAAIAALKTRWSAALAREGKLEQARRAAEEAIEIWRGENAPELAGAYEALGRVLELQGEPHQAEQYCREALHSMDRHGVIDAATRQARLEWQALLLDRMGRGEESAQARAKAAKIAVARRQVPDPESLLNWGTNPTRD